MVTLAFVVQELFSQPSVLKGQSLCRCKFHVFLRGGEFRVFLHHHLGLKVSPSRNFQSKAHFKQNYTQKAFQRLNQTTGRKVLLMQTDPGSQSPYENRVYLESLLFVELAQNREGKEKG